MLDKLWFSPVGKVLDERDALIRSKLASKRCGHCTSMGCCLPLSVT